MADDTKCAICEGAGWDWKRAADEDLLVDDPVDHYWCEACDGTGEELFAVGDDIVTQLRSLSLSPLLAVAAADLLEAIDALHQPEKIMGVLWCQAEDHTWPCPTAQLLHPEEARLG